MKQSSEKVMEVNIELRVNVDQQKYDKTFRVKSDIDDSVDVKKITATRIPMKK